MEEQKDLLVEEEVVNTPATPGFRFANYLIDVVIFYVLMFIFGLLGAGMIDPDNKGQLYLISFGTMMAYYTLLEGGAGGKTIGKLITKTRVVKEDGSAVTFGDALVRTLCRFVPFEPFSAFGGRPWHDKWTKTIVIKE